MQNSKPHKNFRNTSPTRHNHLASPRSNSPRLQNRRESSPPKFIIDPSHLPSLNSSHSSRGSELSSLGNTLNSNSINLNNTSNTTNTNLTHPINFPSPTKSLSHHNLHVSFTRSESRSNLPSGTSTPSKFFHSTGTSRSKIAPDGCKEYVIQANTSNHLLDNVVNFIFKGAGNLKNYLLSYDTGNSLNFYGPSSSNYWNFGWGSGSGHKSYPVSLIQAH